MSNFHCMNKTYKKMQVNFVKIMSICDCFITFFYFYSTWQKQIKAGCNVLKRTALVKIDSRLSFTRSILQSIIKLSASGSDLAFKQYNNAIVLITFDLSILPAIGNLNSFVYLDIGYEIILVYKTYLVKKISSQKSVLCRCS